MKKCPHCNLTFTDDNSFCTEDGVTLVAYHAVLPETAKFSVSLETPTLVVPHPHPQSQPAPLQPIDNSKWLYLVIGAMAAIILGMGVFFLLPKKSEDTPNNSNREISKFENVSSTQNTSKTTLESNAAKPDNAAANSDAPTNAPASNRAVTSGLPRNFNRIYSGTADNDGISMDLRRSGSSLSGNVFSRGSTTDITVSGNIDDDGAFEMNEYSDIGANTGVYRGKINSDGTMRGTWSKPDGSKSRPFSLRAN